MSNKTNSNWTSMVMAIAAGILVMTLGNPAYAASHQPQFAGGAALRSVSGAPASVNGGGNSNDQGDNNNDQGGRTKFAPARNFFHSLVGAVKGTVDTFVVTVQSMCTVNAGSAGLTDDPLPY